MKKLHKFAKYTAIAAILISVAGCSGMTKQGQGTLLGAGAGALGGAALTGGGALGTIGGAAVGGLIGHEVAKPK